MSSKELIVITQCIQQLKTDGIDSKTLVKKRLQKLIDDHNKKWGK